MAKLGLDCAVFLHSKNKILKKIDFSQKIISETKVNRIYVGLAKITKKSRNTNIKPLIMITIKNKHMDNIILLQSMFSTIGQGENFQVPMPPKNITKKSEIELLEDNYGPLTSGRTLTVRLQELLRLLPRKRPRIDSYRSLVKQLYNEHGVNLIIKSRKTK